GDPPAAAGSSPRPGRCAASGVLRRRLRVRTGVGDCRRLRRGAAAATVAGRGRGRGCGCRDPGDGGGRLGAVTDDFMPLDGWDHVELWVGNAKQAAYYYDRAFGFTCTAYAGPETGVRDRAS